MDRGEAAWDLGMEMGIGGAGDGLSAPLPYAHSKTKQGHECELME